MLILQGVCCFLNENVMQHTFCEQVLLNTFQSRMVSSAQPVAMTSQSADMAR
jgi:hypothetical protein